MGEKGSSNTHSCTVVPIPVSVVPIPLFYCRFFLSGYQYQKCGIGTTLLLPCFPALVPVPILVVPVPLYKNFQNSLHFGFHYMLASCTASHPLQIDLCLLNRVLQSLDTFTLTMESYVLHVIKNPKVQT